MACGVDWKGTLLQQYFGSFSGGLDFSISQQTRQAFEAILLKQSCDVL